MIESHIKPKYLGLSIVFHDPIIYDDMMNNDDYLNNILGAFATAVSTQIEQKISDIGGRSLSHETSLVTIFNHPNESIDTLSKVLGLSHSGTVRLINTLEDEQLVERHKSNSDARTVLLKITDEGRKRVAKILQVREQVSSKILNTLTDTQKAALEPVLQTMLDGLTDDQESARRICRICNEKICRPQGCPVETAISNRKH